MLARRFTIVCLLVTLFGMGMSVLVAEKSRTGREQGVVYQFCNTGNAASCPNSIYR